MTSQEQDIAAAKENDAAMADLIRRYDGMIAGMLRTASLADREDWQQEGRMALVRAVQGFDPSKGVRFGTYAFRCVHNAFGAWSKKRPVYGADPDWTQIADKRPGPEDKLLHEEWLAEGCKQAKRLLSPLEYKVWRLRIDGYSYAEIATLLGEHKHKPVTEKTVNNALQRVRGKLRGLQ